MIAPFFNLEYMQLFNLNYADTLKKHFNRLKDELIPCPICGKVIIYTKYHEHIEEWDGEEQEDFKENENSSREQNKMDDSNLLEM